MKKDSKIAIVAGGTGGHIFPAISLLEQLISENLDNWKLERVATLDQLIMRIAVNEIYFNDDIPPKVSISEAIEIAKLYSTKDSSSFVNGVLDAIYKHKLTNDKTT